MRTIFKYPLEVASPVIVQMPAAAEIIHIGLDPQSRLCAWAMVDSQAKEEPVTFHIIGTGHPVAEDTDLGKHMASVVQGPYVWHVFYHGRR